MVQIREARRAARNASAAPARASGTPADTTNAAQAVQDALLKRTSPADKLAQVARLSRMVDQLAMAGLKQRHPAEDEEMIQDRRAELRLGRRLATTLHRARHDA